MSRQQILQNVLGKKLHQLMPLPFPGDTSVVLGFDDLPRQLYVSSDVDLAVMPPFADTDEGKRLGEFRAWLDGFMLGSVISVCQDPYLKPPETDFARVDPPESEIWSIRLREPKDSDGLRALGGFLALDEFIVLRWRYREEIGDNFGDEVAETIAAWQDIFDKEPPHKGEKLNEYLTEANELAY